MLFDVVKFDIYKVIEITNKPPSNSLNPINSLVKNAADTKPTTTSKANNIFILPGSKISTLKYVKKIEGKSQKIENKIIQKYIVSKFKLITEGGNSKVRPPGI